MYNTGSTGLKIYEMDLEVTPATITVVYDNSSQKISCPGNDTTRPFTDGTYIYFPGGIANGVYRFEPISKTCVFLNTLPSSYPTTGSNAPYFCGGCYNPWNNCIYITGPWGNKLAEYNLETASERLLKASEVIATAPTRDPAINFKQNSKTFKAIPTIEHF